MRAAFLVDPQGPVLFEETSPSSKPSVVHEFKELARDGKTRCRTKDGVYRAFGTKRSIAIIDPLYNFSRRERAQAVKAPTKCTYFNLGSMLHAVFVRDLEIQALHAFHIHSFSPFDFADIPITFHAPWSKVI